MNPLVEIIEAFTSFWLWTVVLAITGPFMWYLNDALGKKLNRDQFDRLLDGRRYAVLYHQLLHAALARIDGSLMPAMGPSDDVRQAEGRRAWSWTQFDLSMRLALAYPLLTLLVTWGFLGEDGKLGSLVVLPASWWGVRIAALAWIALVFWLIYRGRRGEPRDRRYLALAYLMLGFAIAFIDVVALAFVGVFAIGGTVAGAFAVAFPVAGAIAGAFASALAVSVAFVFAGALAVCLALSVSLTLAVSVYVPVSVAFAIAVLFTLARGGDFTVAVAGLFVVTFAVAVGVIMEAAAKQTRLGLVAYAGLVALLLLALALVVRYSLEINEVGATLIVFLGLLPLLNALSYFFSIGLTRFLLRRGAASDGLGALGWALGDLATALVSFAFLGMVLVTVMWWMSGLGAAPQLNLGLIFTDIRADPGAYWWLYVTLFSTLLPTLLHFVLASFSALLAIMPESVALFIRRQLPKVEEDAVAKALAFWTLSTIGFLAIAAVAFGLYGLVTGVLAVFPHAGHVYRWLFEHYAAWLGAPVVPVRPDWL